jgi:hypothetical protein
LATYTVRGGGGGPGDDGRQQVMLIGSKDGIHWDRTNQASILTGHISDGWLGMLYDDERRTYVLYGRPRSRYQMWGGSRLSGNPKDSFTNADFMQDSILYAGVVRRLGRMERQGLWCQQEASFQTLFQPDTEDLKSRSVAHMSMMARRYAGVYFGFLVPFAARDRLWTEVITSRDGNSWVRTHQALVPLGARAGAASKPWDVKQVWAFPSWVEVGDEWWFMFMAADASPNVAIDTDGVLWGMCMGRIRKEGFVSLRTPHDGGAIVTRVLKWPGGDLLVNCDASQGEMRVRVTDVARRVYDGFNYSECRPFFGNSVAKKMKWKAHSLHELEGRDVRFEFYFSKDADLYSFRATGSEASRAKVSSFIDR